MSLSALIKKGWLRDVATSTLATSATDAKQSSPSVAAVATVAVAQAQNKAANDPAKEPPAAGAPPAVDFGCGVDHQCWPNTLAMNTAEIQMLIARIDLFLRREQSQSQAEKIADELVIRDRGGENLNLCLECQHLRGQGTSWYCANWQRASQVGGTLPKGLVTLPQRCSGFHNAVSMRVCSHMTRP